MDKERIVTQSIIKRYRKKIWSKFVKAVKEYNLIEESDKIAVCISGGKDSFLLAMCLKELQRHGMFKFELTYIIMDPGYSKEDLDKIKHNLDLLNIDALIFDTNIFKIVENDKSPCYKCAKMRRGYLYDFAQKQGCNKIALGHHLDDVVETIMLGLIYNGTYSSILPILSSKNFEGMKLIRPLYLIEEKDIILWQEFNHLDFIKCGCNVTKKNSGKRQEIKKLIEELEKYNKDVKKSIFSSSTNVNLNTVLGVIEKRDRD